MKLNQPNARQVLPWRIGALLLAMSLALLARPAHAQPPGDVADEMIYIDAAGVMRVRDLLHENTIEITWVSPVAGYTDAVLLDVNGDGDMEIAGVRTAGSATTLDIYDPVVTTGPLAGNQSFGGVPWDTLAVIPLAAPVGFIGVGNLDAATPAAEILLSTRTAGAGSASTSAFVQSVYYLRAVGVSDGRVWEAVGLPVGSRDWNAVALGDMNGDDVDEIALVAKDTGTLEVWQMRGPSDATRVYANENDSRPWLHVAMGSFIGGGRDTLSAVRDAPIGLPSFFVFRWDNGTLADEYGRDFDPSPHFVFMGDINNNGRAEAYMLRMVDAAITNKPRLFMRQRFNDLPVLFEDMLDSDNGYAAGAAGDLDGDGKDELVLIRTTGLRVYLSPDTGVTNSVTPVDTNGRTLVIGDVDRVGFLPEVLLGTNPTAVAASAKSGDPSTPVVVNVAGVPDNPGVPVNIAVAERVPWLSLSGSSFVTPFAVTLGLEAANLSPGIYTTRLILTSPSPLVLAQPLNVPVTFTVGDGLLVRPAGLAFIDPDCVAGAIHTKSLRIEAQTGSTFSVSLLTATAQADDSSGPDVADAFKWPSSVPWLGATSATNVAPENVQLEATLPAGMTAAGARAVVSTSLGSQTLVRTVPITLLCAKTQLSLPLIVR